MARASALLQADKRVSVVIAPQPGVTVSKDGRTSVIQAGANSDANAMVRAADALTGPLAQLATPTVSVHLTGDSALWSHFNNVNHAAMIKSEVLSWPVTMLVLVIAFGSLVAAGLPLMLTLVGLLSAAGALVLSTHIAPISIWALNFAMMFALALGIDYALFLVVRFRAALAASAAHADPRHPATEAIGETMATASKAIAFSGVTVLISLSTVLLVPSPALRSMALGIMLSVGAVLAATLTLPPAVLGRLGPRIDSSRLRLPRALRRTRQSTVPGLDASEHHGHVPARLRGLEHVMHRWGGLLSRRPWIAATLVAVLRALLAWPVTELRTGMPSITIIPADQSARAGYTQVVSVFGPGAPGTLQVLTPAAAQSQAQAVLSADRGVAATIDAGGSAGWTMTQVIPTTDASAPATGATIDRLRHELPSGSLIGGAAAENHDLEKALLARTPLVFGLLYQSDHAST
jgi:putative drug exporter of the RND superfamily